MAFGVCKGFLSCSEETVKGTKIQNLIDLRKRVPVHSKDELRWIDPTLYFQELYFFGMVTVGLRGSCVDHLTHTVLKMEAGDGISLVLPIDQQHIFFAVHHKPPFLVISDFFWDWP